MVPLITVETHGSDAVAEKVQFLVADNATMVVHQRLSGTMIGGISNLSDGLSSSGKAQPAATSEQAAKQSEDKINHHDGDYRPQDNHQDLPNDRRGNGAEPRDHQLDDRHDGADDDDPDDKLLEKT